MSLQRTTTTGVAGAGLLAFLLAGATPILAYNGDETDGNARVVALTGLHTIDAADEGHVIMINDDGESGAPEFIIAGQQRVIGLDGDDAHSIEVRIVNGETEVIVDGKEIPASQLIQKDGAIVVLDDNGDEIKTIEIGPLTGDRTFGFHFGPGDKEVWFGDTHGNIGLPEPNVMLGVQLGEPGAALERHLKLDPGTTTILTSLYEGLPAHAAGLEEHDIITTIDGRTPANPSALRETLAELEPGDTVRFGVISEGSAKTVRVTVSAYDREAMMRAKVIGDAHGMALFGPNVFGRRLELPDDQSLFELDFGNVKDLNRFFLDDSNRLFEMPKGRMRVELQESGGDEPGDAVVEVELDSRLSRLDTRLAALEEMLDALLKEAKRDRR